MLIQYVRRGKKIRGVIVAVKRENGSVGVDYSLCRKEDKFCKNVGLAIAQGRALSDRESKRTAPHSLRKYLQRMTERACRYYKVNPADVVGFC